MSDLDNKVYMVTMEQKVATGLGKLKNLKIMDGKF